jgi:serine/threonine protein kinase
LYEALTGDTPFDGDTHFEIMTKHLSEVPKLPTARGVDVPRDVEDVVMRSLAKQPGDRFDSARDMRKLLEAALRNGDIVQRVSLRAAPLVRATTSRSVRAATAAPGSLADTLEPTDSVDAIPKTKRRRALPWILLALVLVSSGVTAAVLVMNNARRDGEVVATGTFEGILIETTGVLTPEEVARAYRSSVDRLQELARRKGLVIESPVQKILTVSQPTFCEPTAYIDLKPPKDCETRTEAVTIESRQERLLMILDDRASLARTMDVGLAEAVCLLGAGAQCKVAEELNVQRPGD